MKLTAETKALKVNVEVAHDDVSGEELGQLFRQLMLALSYHPDTVAEVFGDAYD